MQQLSGLDAMFLSIDTSTTTGTMGGLLVFDRPDDDTAGRVPAVRARIAERLHRVPPLRWKLAPVPFGLDHAYWAEADRVDVDEHVHRLELPPPGTDRQLAAEVARVTSMPLPRDRPLWDYTVVEGLQGGRIAHLIRIHHSVVDGTLVPLVLDLLSDAPVTAPEDIAALSRPPGRAEPVGGRVELLARGLLGAALRPARLAGFGLTAGRWLAGRVAHEGVLAGPAFLARLVPGELGAPLRRLVNAGRRGTPVLPLVPTLRRPSTAINRRLSSRRSYAFSELPLADFKAVGTAFGTTLNDVVLAVCAGTVRRYLSSRGEVPDRPLVVCIPTSRRDGTEQPPWANHVSMFFAPLPTHLDDPVARLHAVRTAVNDAKANVEALPLHLVRPASTFLPASFFTVPERLLAKAPSWVPAAVWNVVVSNVRGPSTPMSITGARMTGYWPAAFLTPGVGLNVTLQSYVDRLDFGFMGCADVTGDLWGLPGYMAEELAELLDRARTVVQGPGTGSRAPRSRSSTSRPHRRPAATRAR